ncbi:MAG: hypothetical protein J0I09_10525 [Sphingobacteriia bacterium]|nr:hypothetical protein [Sphingobacteriia bacterium]
MESEFKSFEYFKSSLIDPFFELEEVLSNKTHPCYTNLQFDIDNIDPVILEKFVEENNIDKFLDRYEDKHRGRCKFYLIETIQKEIAEKRLEILSDTSNKTLPYTSENFNDINILENNLVYTNQFSLYNNGYNYKDYVYSLSPSTNASNSSYWISSVISNLIEERGLNFKIRLDPFVEKHCSDYSPMFYKMTIYGRKLDWNRLKNIQEDEHGRWMNENFISGTEWTDFVWRPEKNELHFTCEELPKIEDLKIRGSRYFHAIFDKVTGLIKHCDGAIRIYSNEEFNNRLKFHVRNAEVRKIGKRVKIFQLDDFIDQSTFGLIVTNFMVWNQDIFDYFN